MTTKNDTTVATVSPELLKAFAAFEEAEEDLEAAKANVDEAIAALKQQAEMNGGLTFKVGEQYIQIRTRQGQTYVTRLKSAPQDWLKGASQRRAEQAALKLLAERGIHLDELPKAPQGTNPAQDAVDATVGEASEETASEQQGKSAIVL